MQENFTENMQNKHFTSGIYFTIQSKTFWIKIFMPKVAQQQFKKTNNVQTERNCTLAVLRNNQKLTYHLGRMLNNTHL